jgi:hypothetical protein
MAKRLSKTALFVLMEKITALGDLRTVSEKAQFDFVGRHIYPSFWTLRLVFRMPFVLPVGNWQK